MDEVLSRKWIIATIATWMMVIVLDELTYYWWKRLNPGSTWKGLIAQHPTTTSGVNDYPNGPRPAGGQ